MGIRRYKLNYLLLLFIANILLVFLAPFASSSFEGKISGFNSKIDFKVGFLGNWLEHRVFPGFSEGTSMGSAEEIGTYYNACIVLMILALVFCMVGAATAGVQTEPLSEQDLLLRKRLIITKLFGTSTAILGGLLGIFSLVVFKLFKSTIVQPYDAEGFFPINNVPKIRFNFGFIISLAIFVLFVIVGVILLFEVLETQKQLVRQAEAVKINGVE